MWGRLAEPFDPSEIVWMPGSVSPGRDGRPARAQLLAFMNARAVMDRLDEVCGPDGWFDEYTAGPDGGVLCKLHVRGPDGVWIAKQDGAPATHIEAVKGGISGALKRAAVRFGVGRYLYFLDASWVDVEERRPGGPSVYVSSKKDNIRGHAKTPELPGWALPGGSGRPGTSKEDRLRRQQSEKARGLIREMGATTRAEAASIVARASGGSLALKDIDLRPGDVLAALHKARETAA
tara:strand:+ start:116 stop:820 length:705 start_codon:yes stop_codon:yes gene_type:complete